MKKQDDTDRAARKERRIAAACVMLQRQAEAHVLVVDLPFGSPYAIPLAPKGPRGECVPAHIAKAHVEGWQVLYSIVRYQDGREFRNASAMLWPKGRSSVEDDWTVLGAIVARTTQDRAAVDMASAQAGDDDRNPNDPIHWWWETKAAAERAS